MGWIHFQRQVIYRHGGHLQSVGNAAYIHRQEGYDALNREHFNYSDRGDLLQSGMIVPEDAPEWIKQHAKDGSYVEFWEEIENRENQYLENRWHKQTEETILKKQAKAMSYFREIVAILKELNQEQSVRFIEDFIQENYADRGIVTQHAIHWDDNNPHAHVMGVVRKVNENGLASRHQDFGSTFFKQRDLLELSRKTFADIGNRHLVEAGFEPRLDHRSYKDQGLDIEPTVHEGYHARKMHEEGKESKLVSENDRIRAERAAKFDKVADMIVKDVNLTKATFTEADLMREVSRVIGEDLTAYKVLSAKVMAHPDLVNVGTDLRGKERYSTQQYVQSEQKMFSALERLQQQKTTISVDMDRLNATIEKDYSFLSSEQREGIYRSVSSDPIVALEGRAGTGKTTLVEVTARELVASGYKVRGMSLAGAAAENLELETGVKSTTIDKFLYPDKLREDADIALKAGKKDLSVALIERADKLEAGLKLSKNEVVFIDEAGMAGTKHYSEVLTKIADAEAKVVLIGDSAQKKAVAAGGAFEEISKRTNATVLSEIRRQKVEWQREASVQLSNGDVRSALHAYNDHGRVSIGDRRELFNELVNDYVNSLDGEIVSASQRLTMAATNKEVNELNTAIREQLVENGYLENTHSVRGRNWGVNDRIVFLRNQNNDQYVKTLEGNGAGVKNGTSGFVETIHVKGDAVYFDVRLDSSERLVSFRADRGEVQFNHAYAITIDKAQGKTVDRAFLWSSPYMRNDAAYVGMTRHRHDVKLYADHHLVAGDIDDLATVFNRTDNKDLISDYNPSESLVGVHDEMRRFREIGDELKSMYADMQMEALETGKEFYELESFETFQELSAERNDIAERALDNWKDYARSIRQLNITKEQLEVLTGRKDKPLTRIEKVAFEQLREYADMTERARDLWNEIKQTHTGNTSRLHVKWEEFDQLRLERNAYAHKFVQEKDLYGPLVKYVKATPAEQQSPHTMAKNGEKPKQRISWHAIKAQAIDYEKVIDLDKIRAGADPKTMIQLNKVDSYINSRAYAANAFAELKDMAEARGTKIYQTRGYNQWREQMAQVEKMAFELRENGRSDILRVSGLKEKEIHRYARAHELRVAIEDYKSVPVNDYKTRDAKAFALEAIVKQDPEKRLAKAFVSMANENDVSHWQVKRQSAYHEMRHLDRTGDKIDAGRMMEYYDRSNTALRELRQQAKREGLEPWGDTYGDRQRDLIKQREKAAWNIHNRGLGEGVTKLSKYPDMFRKDVLNYGIRIGLEKYKHTHEIGQYKVRDKQAADIMRRLNAHPGYKTSRHMAGFVRSEGLSLKNIKDNAYFHEMRRIAEAKGQSQVIKVVDTVQEYLEQRRKVAKAGEVALRTDNKELFQKELVGRNRLAAKVVELGGVEFTKRFGLKAEDIKLQARNHRLDVAISAYGKADKLDMNKGRIALDIARYGADATGRFGKDAFAKLKSASIEPEMIKRDASKAILQDGIKPNRDGNGQPAQHVRDQVSEYKFKEAFAEDQQAASTFRNAYEALDKEIKATYADTQKRFAEEAAKKAIAPMKGLSKGFDFAKD
jgi:Ti-type conjugative transfer relaxase TraA